MAASVDRIRHINKLNKHMIRPEFVNCVLLLTSGSAGAKCMLCNNMGFNKLSEQIY